MNNAITPDAGSVTVSTAGAGGETAGTAIPNATPVSRGYDPQKVYRSFWELPRLTHLCGAIIIVVGVTNVVLMLSSIQWNGWLWLLFYSVVANTAVSVFPHEPAIVYYGQHFNAIIVALVAGAGHLIANWVDYHFFTPLLQMKFTTGYKNTRTYQKAVRWFSISPFWVVVLFALTPLPFYAAKFMVFSSGYSMTRYMVATLVGRLPRFVLLALLGSFLHIPTWMMVVFFCGVFAVYLAIFAGGWVRTRLARRAAG